MPVLPLVDLFILMGTAALGIGFILKAIDISTHFRPTILGFSSLVVMLGTITAPILAGALNDATGSYRVGFTIIALLASSGVVFFLLATPPDPPERSGDGPVADSASHKIPV